MSNGKFADTVSKLQKIQPWDVPLNTDVQEHIITLYNAVHRQGGEAFCEREARYLNRAIIDDKKKWNCTSLSVFLAFVDLAVKNLTLEPGTQPLCYLLNRSTKLIGGDGKEFWENRCYISITGYGEILLRQRAGQIRHCDTPTVVYEGDEFSYAERDGRKFVSYALNLQHNAMKPIACFMKITRLDNTVDYAIILPEGWARLASYSAKQNKGHANELYASNSGAIDSGFLIAKCVKHAFKSYPKLPIGKGMVMEADLPEEEAMPDYYAMGVNSAASDIKEADTNQNSSMPESFDTAPVYEDGVVIDTADTDDDDTW